MNSIEDCEGFPIIRAWGQVVEVDVYFEIIVTPYLVIQLDENRYMNISANEYYDSKRDEEIFHVVCSIDLERKRPEWVRNDFETILVFSRPREINIIEQVRACNFSEISLRTTNNILKIVPSRSVPGYLDIHSRVKQIPRANQ